MVDVQLTKASTDSVNDFLTASKQTLEVIKITDCETLTDLAAVGECGPLSFRGSRTVDDKSAAGYSLQDSPS